MFAALFAVHPAATLIAKGVTFKSDIIPSPVCRRSIIEDSEGNTIVLHQLRAK